MPAFRTLGFGAATFGAFVLSAAVGLLGVHTSWQVFYDFAAAAAEVVSIVVGALLLLPARSRASAAASSVHRRRHAS